MSSQRRVWFVTGSSSGFGLLIVKRALDAGDSVIATLRKPEVLSCLVQQYKQEQLLVLRLDVTQRQDVTSCFEQGKKHFGRIDVVFNNAGIGVLGEVEGTSEELARQVVEVRTHTIIVQSNVLMLEVDFWGATNVMREAIACFRDFNNPSGGKFLHMTSMLDEVIIPGTGWYAAA